MKEKTVNNQKYYLFDAKDEILGRLAVKISKILSGKNIVNYQPNKKNNHWVILINSDLVKLSREKEGKKIYWSYSGYPGGIKGQVFKDLMKEDSKKVIEKAVRGMLPKNKLSHEAMRRLRVYKDEKHGFGNIFK